MSELSGKKLKNKGKVYIYDDVVIANGLRTPFGKFNGSYSKYSASELGTNVSKELMKASVLSNDEIDQVIFANTIPSSTDSIFLARHVALKSGLDYNTPASMVQRICASGFETIINAANDICAGVSEYTLAGGAENMTRAPLVSFDIRSGFNLGEKPFSDLLWEGLFDTYCDCSMGQTAENLAKKYSITRDEVDEFAFISHSRAITAKQKGILKDEICHCQLLESDETIRDTVSIEKIKKLHPVFNKNGVQTAANSSLIADGAAAVIITKSSNYSKNLGRILGASVVGVEPQYMGISPVKAINILLEAFNLSLNDIDLFEINEAFGAQYIACERELNLDRDKVNVNGGSIAIGHPLAATGIRLSITLLRELKRRNKKNWYSISMCRRRSGHCDVTSSLKAAYLYRQEILLIE